jgi:hypothetical protein
VFVSWVVRVVPGFAVTSPQAPAPFNVRVFTPIKVTSETCYFVDASFHDLLSPAELSDESGTFVIPSHPLRITGTSPENRNLQLVTFTSRFRFYGNRSVILP